MCALSPTLFKECDLAITEGVGGREGRREEEKERENLRFVDCH